MNNKYTLHTLLILLHLTCLYSFAQPVEVLSTLQSRPEQYKRAKTSSINQKTQMLSLPFQDDFSKQIGRPDSNLWEDDFVYINQTLAQQPFSIGTATFDGIDNFGLAYDVDFLGTDTADMLTSKPINLTGTTGNVILSFYYQPQGKLLAEAPENQDSLALYFYNPALNKWFSQWFVQGSPTKPFEYVAIVVDPSFYQANFQFRFISYGAGAGAYDMWHVDYVILDDQRNLNDTISFNDICFTEPHPPLINNYEAVPWFHYGEVVNPSNNLFKTQLALNYVIHSPFSSSIPNFLGVYQFSETRNGITTVLKQDNVGNPNIDLNHNNNEYIQYNVVHGSYENTALPTDEFRINAYQSWNGPNDAVFPSNDTIYYTQEFKNYYAYDDGSAERGYGVENVSGALTLVKYDVLDFATLKGLYIYFLPAGTNAELNQFNIVVYTNNSGVPGSLIYQSDSLYTPAYTAPNFYFPYVLDTTGIDVNGSVFIGVKQKTVQRLNIGFDINRNQPTTFFFGRENNLYQSFLAGSVMMRPFFNYLPPDVSIPEVKTEHAAFNLYPNPAKSNLHVSVLNSEQQATYLMQTYSLSGKLMLQTKNLETVDISTLPNGIYIVKLAQLKTSTTNVQLGTKKLVIAR